MFTAVLTVLGLLLAPLPFLWAVGTNTFIRTEAQKRPNSWLYLYIKLFDQILDATLLRSADPIIVQVKVQSNDRTSSCDLVEHNQIARMPEAISSEYGIRVFIDLRVNVPERAWLFFRPGRQLLLLVGFLTLTFGLLSIALAQFIDIVPLLVSYFLLGYGLLALASYGNGPFNIAMNLHWNPTILIFMTRRWLFVHSSWLPRTDISNPNVQFVASEGKFISELAIERVDRDVPTVIFSYPTYFRKFIMSEGDLCALAEKLNKLFKIARNAPDVDPDKLLVNPLQP